jgi:MFS family permease
LVAQWAAVAIVAEVVQAELRHAANALLRIGQNSVKVAGPALGGVLVAAFGSARVIGWEALTLAASAVLFAWIDLAAVPVKMQARFLADLRESWTDLHSRRWLWVMVAQAAAVVPV